MIASPALAAEMVHAENALAGALDLAKDWDILNFLIAGKSAATAPPLGYAIMGHRDFFPNDPNRHLRYVTSDEVAQIASALSQLTEFDLRRRRDNEAMVVAQSLYAFSGDEDDSDFDDYVDLFYLLRTYYAGAGALGCAIVSSIS